MKIFREMVRNTAMGVQSIEDMLDYIECDKLKNLVLSQKEVLEDFYQKAASELGEKELENAIKEAFKYDKKIAQSGRENERRNKQQTDASCKHAYRRLQHGHRKRAKVHKRTCKRRR